MSTRSVDWKVGSAEHLVPEEALSWRSVVSPELNCVVRALEWRGISSVQYMASVAWQTAQGPPAAGWPLLTHYLIQMTSHLMA